MQYNLQATMISHKSLSNFIDAGKIQDWKIKGNG